MKKLLFGICLSIALLVASGSWCIALNQPVYAETTLNTTEVLQESEESNYFRDKVMPYIVANASSICSALIVVIASLSKIKAATAELKNSNYENGELKQKNEELRKTVNDLQGQIEVLTNDLATIKEDSKKLVEMAKIAFCNTKELVVNGYASKIAEVANEDEEKTES